MSAPPAGSGRVVALRDAADPAAFGPKAATLAAMVRAGLPVPDGACIPQDAYRAHACRAGVADLAGALGGLKPDDPEVGTVLARIRSRIVDTRLDTGLLGELAAARSMLGPGPVAVRSSGTAEDLPGLSFAGQHGTYFAAGASDVPRLVAECWASLWSDRAWRYRARAGMADPSMAVIVQHLVAADVAGVAFTADPSADVSGDPPIVIESVRGIGETLVSGRVTPDRHVISRSPLEVRDAIPGSKVRELVVTADGAIAERDTDPRHAGALALSEHNALAVARLALACEGRLGRPVDVEWALADGELSLLQARPITSVAAAPDSTPPIVWSDANTGEVLPDVVTPMSWSLVRSVATGLIETAFGMIGLDLSRCELVRLHSGRAYFNITVLSAAFRSLPVPGGSIDLTALLGGMQEGDEIARAVLARPVPEVDLPWWRVVASIPRLAAWTLRNSGKAAAAFTARTRAGTEAALAELDASLDDPAALCDLALRTAEGVRDLKDAISFATASMSGMAQLRSITAKWLGDADGSLSLRLMVARGGLDSAEAGMDMARLAHRAGRSPAIAAILRAEPYWASASAALQAGGGEGSAAFLRAWDAFMIEHGHHSRGELELSNPRWSERPDLVLDTVRALLDTAGGESPDEIQALRAREAADLAAECRSLLRSPLRRAWFDHVLADASAGARMRENAKNEGVRRIAAVRTVLLALGGSLAGRGLLEHPDDIFFVTLDELEGVADGTAGFDVRATVASRRAQHAIDETLRPPHIIFGEWDPATAAPSAGPAVTELRGMGVSPGVATGPARVVATVDAEATVLPGEILVAPFTDPGWTPLFMPAAGIVVDMGGLLSHGSIIAREYGKPAVVNVGAATTTIRTGQIVTVDGSRGVVTVDDRP